ncbi:uncharacterized protein DS421_10g306780 [Arachis hypogaea]|nr:uncharacterized protein DS421_10g306780 [Arachis hypogaea]
MAIILGLSTNGLPVTGPTMSSFEALEVECLHQFGVALRKTDYRGSFIKLIWFRGLKDSIVLNDVVHIQMYDNSYRLQGDGRSIDTVVHLGLDPATISSADSRQSPSVFNCKQVSGVTGTVKTMPTDIIRLRTTGGCWMIYKNDSLFGKLMALETSTQT